MKTVIAGGTGFLGSALARQLTSEGHEVVILARQRSSAQPPPRTTYAPWTPDGTSGGWRNALQNADVIVNLSGESIAARRWSPAQKTRIKQSRLDATRSLTAAIQELATPPRAFVSASAVGYYGNRGDETLTEASSPGNDFLAEVCKAWETAAMEVRDLTRVAIIRTGLPLDRRGGALPKMLLPFSMFAGGPMGSGRQYMPWIHLQDWVRLVTFAIQHEGARGPLNATGPNPATNAEFAKALGHALKRPSFMPAPAFALRLALGEMADALLLSGQRVLPVRAADLGFAFRFADLDDALADIFSRRERRSTP